MVKKHRAKPFSLRIDDDIRNWYQSEADKNKRSLNSEFSKTLHEKMIERKNNQGEK